MLADAPTTLVFVDIETTGLDWRRHGITELGWIVRTPDGQETEKVRHPEVSLEGAEPIALELSRYWERIAPLPTTPLADVIREFIGDADGATLVGANVAFDALRIDVAAHSCGLDLTWDYRLHDVESSSAPLISEPGNRVPSLAACANGLGVPYDKDEHHDALYDARLARDVYDAGFSAAAMVRQSRNVEAA